MGFFPLTSIKSFRRLSDRCRFDIRRPNGAMAPLKLYGAKAHLGGLLQALEEAIEAEMGRAGAAEEDEDARSSPPPALERRAEEAKAAQAVMRTVAAAELAEALERGSVGGGAPPPTVVAEALAPKRLLFDDPASAAAGAAPECIVCLERARTHAGIPCGHRVLCAECAAAVTTCPICRSPVSAFLRVYE